MASNTKASELYAAINLIYIRAAIEANTGVRLTLPKVRQYLVEEGLITKSQARKYAQIRTSYAEFYEDYTGVGYVVPPEELVELTGIYKD